MRELLLAGFVTAAFGLGATRGTGEPGVFGAVNLAAAALCLGSAAVLSLRRWTPSRARETGPVLDTALGVVAVVWGAILLQHAAHLSGLRTDWTLERRFDLAPATRSVLEELPGPLRATLYADRYDPRRRRTHLLLEELARHGEVAVRVRHLEDAPAEEDRFAIRSSNTVVLELGDRWERVDRPTEGTLYEALSYLTTDDRKVLYVTTGAGEGDLGSRSDVGYSGLGAALESEGVQVRKLVSTALEAIPADADAVMLVAPRRRLRPSTLEAVRRFLAQGGSLVAFLEPGAESGLSGLLESYGLRSPDAVVVDPASAGLDGRAPGLDPIASHYASDSLVTRGLDTNRRTYFRGARSFVLRKPRVGDDVEGVVFAGPRSWLHPDPSVLERRSRPAPPPGARRDYWPLVVTGVYERESGTARIVAFGDADFASNAHLRSLYNLDLVLNAVHWALREEPEITLRPKAGGLIQFPVPIQNTLRAFYGVGLLVPELLLLVGGLVWLRRRSA